MFSFLSLMIWRDFKNSCYTKYLGILFFFLLLFFSGKMEAQVNLLNDPVKIVLNQVKKVHIYRAKLNGGKKDYKEELMRVIYYDGLGRRIHMDEYSDNILLGTWTYFYLGNTFKCIRTSYCVESGSTADLFCEYVTNPINTQTEYFYTPFEVKYTISEKGLISSITGYSKEADMDQEIEKMKEKMKDSPEPWNVNVHKIPVLYLRYEYIPF
jgi:hypothetical protein